MLKEEWDVCMRHLKREIAAWKGWQTRRAKKSSSVSSVNASFVVKKGSEKPVAQDPRRKED
jgi:hypothetical protein